MSANDMRDDGRRNRTFPEDSTERAVKLLRRFFHLHFCVTEEIPQVRKPEVLPAYFCGWLDKHMGSFDQTAECEAAGVPASTWDFVRGVLDRGTAPEALFQVWYAIVLSDRPDPVHKVKNVNVVVNVTYEDGSISTTQAFVSQEMMGDGPRFDDATLFSMLQANFRTIQNQMVAYGIDQLHDRAQVDATFTHPETDPYDFMMGFLMKFLIRGETFPVGAYNMEPTLKRAVTTWFRLAQQLLRPVLPPAAIAALKRQQAKQSAEDKGKVFGGWDV